MPIEEFITCACNHCDGKIEFPYHGVGTEVECPHCHIPTTLFQPAAGASPSSDTAPGFAPGAFIFEPPKPPLPSPQPPVTPINPSAPAATPQKHLRKSGVIPSRSDSVCFRFLRWRIHFIFDSYPKRRTRLYARMHLRHCRHDRRCRRIRKAYHLLPLLRRILEAQMEMKINWQTRNRLRLRTDD